MEIKVSAFLKNPQDYKACNKCRSINLPKNIKCVLCDNDFFDIVQEEDLQRLREYSKKMGIESIIIV